MVEPTGAQHVVDQWTTDLLGTPRESGTPPRSLICSSRTPGGATS